MLMWEITIDNKSHKFNSSGKVWRNLYIGCYSWSKASPHSNLMLYVIALRPLKLSPYLVIFYSYFYSNYSYYDSILIYFCSFKNTKIITFIKRSLLIAVMQGRKLFQVSNIQFIQQQMWFWTRRCRFKLYELLYKCWSDIRNL